MFFSKSTYELITNFFLFSRSSINISACIVDEMPSKNAEALRLSYYVDTSLLYRDAALDQLLTDENRERGSSQDRSSNATLSPLEPERPAMRTFKRHLHLSAHRHEKPVAHAECRDKLLEDYARCLQNALDAVQRATRATHNARPLLLLLHDDMIAGPALYEQILDLHFTQLPELYGRNYAQKLGLVKLYSPRAQQRFTHMSVGEWLFFIVFILSLATVFTVLTKLYCGRHRFSAVWRPTPKHALIFFVYVFYLSLLLFLLGRPAAIAIYQRLTPAAGPLLLDSRARSLSGCCHHAVLYTESGARQLAEYLSRALTVQDLARLADEEHDAADPLSDARQPDHYAAHLARFLADFSSNAPFHTLELLAPSALTHVGLYPTCGNRLVPIDLL